MYIHGIILYTYNNNIQLTQCSFKVWAMANVINGYMYDFNVYTGATEGRERALGEKVVLTLSESIIGCHHKLFFDNYFTSVNLLSTLLEKDTRLWYYSYE